MIFYNGDIPYPDITDIKSDSEAVKIIAPAYASERGELNTVLQYAYQTAQLKNQGYDEFAQTLKKISVEEMEHLSVLADLLLRLGVSPVYSAYPPYPANFYFAGNVSYSRLPQKIFIDDIAAEQGAIDVYKGILRRLTNEGVAAVIKRILLDEEAHLAEFKRMFGEYNSIQANNGRKII